jgi:hypothetical protein
MSYELTFTRKQTFLHAVVTGQNSVLTVMRYLQDIQRACVAEECFKVLIEERLEGPRLRAFEVFDIASHGSAQAAGVMKAVAYVDVKAEGNLMQLAENVAVNRGLQVAVFPTVAAAEAWLVQIDVSV